MAPAYVLDGALRDEFNGRYVLAGECNGKPAYQSECGGYVLFQPTDTDYWKVGPPARLLDCDTWGYLNSNPDNGCCHASPDGAGCAGTWQTTVGDCGSSWCDLPSVSVSSWCPDDSVCW